MMSKKIIDTDNFLDMPQSTQCLYFHLLLRADDDGFIQSPKSIMRITGCKEDDLKLLIAKGFVIGFETVLSLSVIGVYITMFNLIGIQNQNCRKRKK